jgi:hypothetical protein
MGQMGGGIGEGTYSKLDGRGGLLGFWDMAAGRAAADRAAASRSAEGGREGGREGRREGVPAPV